MSPIHAPTVEPRPDQGDGPEDAPSWHTIPAEEIAKRGLAAVDSLLADGPVRVTVERGPGYVIMSQALFDEWLDDRHEAYLARVRLALADLEAGRVERYESAEAMMEAIHRFHDDEQ